MVVKEFLEDKGVQLSRFKQFRVNKAAARRSLKRLQGGEISVPTQPTEPLHDIKEHIANVLTELPSHLDNEEKNAFQDIIECSLGGKGKLRGCDYRLAAVIVAQYLRGNENKIIKTITIIQ